MHYVYILTSLSAPNKIYIGSTTDLERRLEEHNQGKSPYSKQYIPWELKTYVAFSNKPKADACEKYLKSGSGFAFMKKRLL